MEKPSPRMQIRNLPYRIYRELSRLLDTPGDKDWKAFVSVLPDGMYARKQVFCELLWGSVMVKL